MSAPAILWAETDSPDQTRALAAAVADVAVDSDLVVLTGDLGAGKTCFTQGLGAGLGIEARITSPTFTLASAYDGRLRLNHLDVYRLDGPGDAFDLDLPELLEAGVTVVEWGEKIAAILPTDRLTIDFRYLDRADVVDQEDGGDDERRLRIELAGAAWLDRRPSIEAALRPWLAAPPC